MPTLSISDLEKYAYVDPASGRSTRNNRRLARQAIVVGARDHLDRWFFLHLWAGRLTASDFRDKILSIQEQFSPRRIGIEANGMQVLFGDLVREAGRARFGTINIVPVYQPTNIEKNFRIRTGLQPIILQGRLFVPPTAIETISELQGFPTAATKDIVDAMETCIRTAPRRPISISHSAEADQYESYLRATNTPSHLIPLRLSEAGFTPPNQFNQ